MIKRAAELEKRLVVRVPASGFPNGKFINILDELHAERPKLGLRILFQ